MLMFGLQRVRAPYEEGFVGCERRRGLGGCSVASNFDAVCVPEFSRFCWPFVPSHVRNVQCMLMHCNNMNVKPNEVKVCNYFSSKMLENSVAKQHLQSCGYLAMEQPKWPTTY